MRQSLQAMRALLDPTAIAVVGASHKPGRGTSMVVNLRDAGTCPRRMIAYSGWMPAALMMAP
jgi:hypothetical protein